MKLRLALKLLELHDPDNTDFRLDTLDRAIARTRKARRAWLRAAQEAR